MDKKKDERLKRYKNYIRILNEKNSTESKLEKQKKLSIIGKRLFNEYISNNNRNSQSIRKRGKTL